MNISARLEMNGVTKRSHGISVRLAQRWETEFRPVIRASHIDRDVPYKNIEPHIGPFFEAVQVRMLNSDTGEVLDYEREPSLKAIGIGGNKLSRVPYFGGVIG